jgi:hypoxanthine phosphoribosyltransferase
VSGLSYHADVELEPRFSEAEIGAAVARIAGEISRDYAGETPVLVGVLKGSFVFLADLVRELSIPCEVDFVAARSYGASQTSSGAVEITKELDSDVTGRHVVVVEDIADTGLTMRAVEDHLRASRPASIRCCALLVREGCDEPDYAGLRVGPGFVVGYGIDYAERYRGLRDIRALPSTMEHADQGAARGSV